MSKSVFSMQRSDTVEYAVKLHEMAVAARNAGRLRRAKDLAGRALRLMERTAGWRHPDVANVLNNLAGIHEDLGNYSGAERLYARSVKIMKRMRGADVARLRVQSLVG